MYTLTNTYTPVPPLQSRDLKETLGPAPVPWWGKLGENKGTTQTTAPAQVRALGARLGWVGGAPWQCLGISRPQASHT